MRALLASIILIILTLPTIASAYVPSPQNGAVELKFGPHRPDGTQIPLKDSNQTFEDLFGNNDSLFSMNLELDWQFARIPEIMSFAVGFSIGIMHSDAKASISEDEESSDKISFNVIPLALLAVIRFDVLADKLSVPFVPYVKAGPNWYPWWSKYADNRDGHGGTLGWQFNPGLAFRLDWIDRTTARTFDNEIGVNHSYIFFELMIANITSNGDAGKFPFTPTNIGDNATWSAGLCLEF